MNKKLYKSSTDKQLCGVCGGLGEYLGIDSTIIRVIWAVFILCAGMGLALYIVCALIIPIMPDGTVTVVDEADSTDDREE